MRKFIDVTNKNRYV